MKTTLQNFIEEYKDFPRLVKKLDAERYAMLDEAEDYIKESLSDLSEQWGFYIRTEVQNFIYPEEIDFPDDVYYILTGDCIIIELIDCSNAFTLYYTGLLDLEDTLKKIKEDTKNENKNRPK